MTELRTLLTGRVFVESPRWHDDRLWFSDWGTGEVIAVDLEGTSQMITRVRSRPFCFDFLPDGTILVVSGGDGHLLRQEANGSLVTHADLRGLSGHPWNEIVVDGKGSIYLNNIGFDFPTGKFAPGIIALVTPEGTITQVAADLAFPNGMAITPDTNTLIVAESYANRLTAFDIAADGSLSNRHVWAEVGDDHPDGICLDADGAVWYADVGTKRCVRVRKGGEILQEITLDRGCFACMLGGAGRTTLFLLGAVYDPATMFTGLPTGEVVITEAPASGAGWPSN